MSLLRHHSRPLMRKPIAAEGPAGYARLTSTRAISGVHE